MDEREATQAMCQVVRPAASYEGKQGPTYAPGISADTVGARGIWLGVVTIAPGARTKAHFHANHESAFYVLSGEIDLWHGEGLRRHDRAHAGDYLFIPPGVPHVAVNASRIEPAVVVGGRTDPNEQESVVLQPELDDIVPLAAS